VKRNPELKVSATKESAERWVVSMAGREWVATEGKRAHVKPEEISSILDSPSKNTTTTETATPNQDLSSYLSELLAANPAPLSQKKKGHQVLLRGLPQSVSEENVRELGKGFRVDDTYGVWRVPKYVPLSKMTSPNHSSNSSFPFLFAFRNFGRLQADRTVSHIISLPSPSEAYRFVRAVHNRRYGGKAFDREFVMRAEVVW
jgi:hypothetical protein